MGKPKKNLSSKSIHKNPYFQIREDRFENTKGKKQIYYVMTANAGVIIIAFDRKKKLVYLVKNFRHPIKKYQWEVPAGMVDRNETPLMSAKRELLEETGLKAKKWKSLGSFFLLPGVTNRKAFVYVAERLEKIDNAIIDDEISQIEAVSLNVFENMLKQGKLTGAPTMVGAYRFLDYLKKK